MNKVAYFLLMGLVVVLMACVPAFQASAEGTCYVRRGGLYRGDDGYWRLSFSNGCNYSVFVTVHYGGAGPGVCIAPGGSGDVTLYSGSQGLDGSLTWDAQPSNCGG